MWFNFHFFSNILNNFSFTCVEYIELVAFKYYNLLIIVSSESGENIAVLLTFGTIFCTVEFFYKFNSTIRKNRRIFNAINVLDN